MYESTIIVTFYKKMALLVNAFSKYFTILSNIVQHGLHVWCLRVSGSVSDTSESYRMVIAQSGCP